MSDWSESPSAARERWHTEARERDEAYLADDVYAQRDAAEIRAEFAEREVARLREDLRALLCTICGQPSPNTAECDDCFIASDDAFRRAGDR